MNLVYKRCLRFLLLIIILLLSITVAFASENVTDNISFNDSKSLIVNSENPDEIMGNSSSEEVFDDKISTDIYVNDVCAYYKEKTGIVGYLKDNNGTPIANKKLNISLNGCEYIELTDEEGKITLDVDLKPNNYDLKIGFLGDDNYNGCETSSVVKIKKAPLIISTKNYNTYVYSGLFFTAKVYNEITKSPMAGIRVLFKVYSIKTKKFYYYYGITNSKGIATLSKNLKVGSYRIYTQIKDSKQQNYISYKNSKRYVTMNVKPTAEVGCCSYYVHVSSSEAVTGFRRDSTFSANLFIKAQKWYGRTAIRQYKTFGGYFCHSIVTSDGWMIGTGGIDNVNINKAIERLSGNMVYSGIIKKQYIQKIQKYISSMGIGHYVIKSPKGNYAVVWTTSYSFGKLKPGQYICVPNSKASFRHGYFRTFDEHPAKAGLKIVASDPYGVNRRDITVYYWKATTVDFKTTSKVAVYAANDNGNLVGKSTAYLKDNIYYKNTFVSKDSLPKSPNIKFLGLHSFGNIDRIVKILTVIKAPERTNQVNHGYFNVLVKNKKTNKVISNVKVKIRIVGANISKTYIVKTNNRGIAKLGTYNLKLGSYNVVVSTADNRYLISARSKIVIKE